MIHPRCATCPRNRPGPCFVETAGTRFMCESHARGETTFTPLLTGEKEMTPADRMPRPDVPLGQPVPSFSELAELIRCPHRFEVPCGCKWPFRCRAAYGQTASHSDCAKCLRARKAESPS